MKIAYFDCFAGISGDMILGALVDAGLELAVLKEDLSLLGLTGYEVVAEHVTKRGISGTKVTVRTEEEKAHRHLADIQRIIGNSGLPEPVKEQSIAVFTRLAEAEARIHATTAEKIHFHEVGALDAIIDIVGAVSGLFRLGIEEVYASPVRTGTGFVKCAHGLLPVPAPAALELLKGVPLYGGEIEKELVTPTGAAVLTTFSRGYGSLPPMKVLETGYGAGGWDLPIPNLLRIIIGEKTTGVAAPHLRFGGRGEIRAEAAVMVEVNLDDMNPELYEHLMQVLWEAGAMDVSLVPIQMKKNRPATMLKVLTSPDRLAAVQKAIFRETTSIGLRVYPVEKYMLPYELITVTGSWGPQRARVKTARLGEEILNLAPEYEDCRQIAREQGLPLKEVYEAVKKAAREKLFCLS